MKRLGKLTYYKKATYIGIAILIVLDILGLIGRIYIGKVIQNVVENEVKSQVEIMASTMLNADSANIHPSLHAYEYRFKVVDTSSGEAPYSTISNYEVMNDTSIKTYVESAENVLLKIRTSEQSIATTVRYGKQKYVVYVCKVKGMDYLIEGAVLYTDVSSHLDSIIVIYDVFSIGLLGACFISFMFARKFHKREMAIEEKQKMAVVAEQQNQAKSDFLANMSHEIRTPINSILGMNEMILRESTQDEIYNYASDIKSAGDSLLSLINDILDYSKIEAGRLDLYESDYEVPVLVNDLVNMIRIRAISKGLEFTSNVDTHTPKTLHGDKVRVQQIIMNLLTNAVKYTDEGMIALRISWDEDIEALRVNVIDTGKGIKRDDIEHLCDKYTRVDLENNSNIEGTGLGLTITRLLLDEMHGDMHIKSEYGVGSTFTVIIPQIPVGSELIGEYSIPTRKKEVYRRKFIAPRAKILAVDDTHMNLLVIQKLLKDTKVEIDLAHDGNTCIDMVRQNDYDIIFMDIRMPYMGGEETLDLLKKKGLLGDTPVVALTADALPESKSKYLEEGFAAYLAKPVKAEELEDMVASMLPKDKIIRSA